MTTTAQAQAEIDEFIRTAVGLPIDPDEMYGLQCKDLPDYYGMTLFQRPLFATLAAGDAETVLDGAHPGYWDVIRNDLDKPGQIPVRGDVIVWDGTEANTFGHVAIVTAATPDGVTVIEQDGGLQVPVQVSTWPYYLAGTGMVAGWIRPKAARIIYTGADTRGYGTTKGTPMPSNYEMITNRDATAFTPAAQVRAVFGVSRPWPPVSDVAHHWGDPSAGYTFDSVCRQFQNTPAGGTSAHYVLEAGRVAQLVDEANASHANGHAAANAQTVTWELNPRCSAEDRETFAQALADVWIGRGMTTPGLIEKHKDYLATECPGRWEQHLPAIQRRAAELFKAKRTGKVAPAKPVASTTSKTPAKTAPVKTTTPKKASTTMTPRQFWSYTNAKVNGAKDAYALLTECVVLLRKIAAKVGA